MNSTETNGKINNCKWIIPNESTSAISAWDSERICFFFLRRTRAFQWFQKAADGCAAKRSSLSGFTFPVFLLQDFTVDGNNCFIIQQLSCLALKTFIYIFACIDFNSFCQTTHWVFSCACRLNIEMEREKMGSFRCLSKLPWVSQGPKSLHL